MELPGHGESTRTADASTPSVADALAHACARIPELAHADTRSPLRVVLLAHSLGTDVALQLAARHASIAGVALVNPVGLQPHAAIRPYALMQALARALDVPLLAPFIQRYLWYMYVYAYGFPKRISVAEVAWCQRRVAGRDFDAMARNCATLRTRGTPVFMAYAHDDTVVEEAVSRELSALLPSGPRYAYTHGGHYLAKVQAAALAGQLVRWIDGLK